MQGVCSPSYNLSWPTLICSVSNSTQIHCRIHTANSCALCGCRKWGRQCGFSTWGQAVIQTSVISPDCSKTVGECGVLWELKLHVMVCTATSSFLDLRRRWLPPGGWLHHAVLLLHSQPQHGFCPFLTPPWSLLLCCHSHTENICQADLWKCVFPFLSFSSFVLYGSWNQHSYILLSIAQFGLSPLGFKILIFHVYWLILEEICIHFGSMSLFSGER